MAQGYGTLDSSLYKHDLMINQLNPSDVMMIKGSDVVLMVT